MTSSPTYYVYQPFVVVIYAVYMPVYTLRLELDPRRPISHDIYLLSEHLEASTYRMERNFSSFSQLFGLEHWSRYNDIMSFQLRACFVLHIFLV